MYVPDAVVEVDCMSFKDFFHVRGYCFPRRRLYMFSIRIMVSLLSLACMRCASRFVVVHCSCILVLTHFSVQPLTAFSHPLFVLTQGAIFRGA